MTLIAVVSAKGAPGVTTVAVALAALGPRPTFLADLDPAGGDVALRYRAPDGSPLDPERGLLSLGAELRRGPTGPTTAHLQTMAGGLEVLTGIGTPDQTVALGPIWPMLGRVLRQVPDRDVIADCGRIGTGSPAMPVLAASDLVLFVCQDSAEQLAHLRERLRSLLGAPLSGCRLAVLVVAPEHRRNAAADAQQLLESSGLPVPVLGAVAEDSKGAQILHGLRSGVAARTTLVRSVRSLLPAVYDVAAADPVPVG